MVGMGVGDRRQLWSAACATPAGPSSHCSCAGAPPATYNYICWHTHMCELRLKTAAAMACNLGGLAMQLLGMQPPAPRSRCSCCCRATAAGTLKCNGEGQEKVLSAAAAGGGGSLLLVPTGTTHASFDDVLLLFGSRMWPLMLALGVRTAKLDPPKASAGCKRQGGRSLRGGCSFRRAM